MEVVGAIIENFRGEFLLQHRTPGAPSYPSTWTIFGGIVEGKETLREAILRELNEELEMEEKHMILFKKIQENTIEDGVKQTIFYILTDSEVSDFTLKEGDDFEFVKPKELFNRDFGFNIKEVFEKYFESK